MDGMANDASCLSTADTLADLNRLQYKKSMEHSHSAFSNSAEWTGVELLKSRTRTIPSFIQ